MEFQLSDARLDVIVFQLFLTRFAGSLSLEKYSSDFSSNEFKFLFSSSKKNMILIRGQLLLPHNYLCLTFIFHSALYGKPQNRKTSSDGHGKTSVMEFYFSFSVGTLDSLPVSF